MRALQLTAVNQLALGHVADPTPAVDEVIVAVKAAALNHRDVWIKSGQYAGLKYPSIPGSDGAGVVMAAGDKALHDWIGRDVIINPCFGWGDNEHSQDPKFTILGLPREGTLAEKIAVPVVQLSAKPGHLSWEEAAALPLTGLTAYRAVFSRAVLKPTDRVLITGIGGGAAVFALQFAVASGAEVWVTSSSADKIARAVTLGAKGGFDYTKPEWPADAATAAGAFNVIVDSAGGDGFEKLLDLAAPGARIVFFGATRGNPPLLPMRKVFWRQLSLLGTTMGSPADWRAMLEFTTLHHLKPIISEVFPFARATEAFALMERSGQFGKIVLRIQ
ncbi:MAG: zinc-binding dehydrogenase [Opitutaceae bacterium]